MDFSSLHKQNFVVPCCLHICNPCNCISQVKSDERYQNRVVSFGLNIAYMKIWIPNPCCTDNTWFLQISGHFGGVYQSYPCSSYSEFLFSFVYVMYLSIASYLIFGKQIKSNLGNKFYLWMIFILCTLESAFIHECRTKTLKKCRLVSIYTHVSRSCYHISF